MKIIEPSFEILNEGDSNNYLRTLERIGRVCYKSEDKISDLSFKKFIKNIVDRGHWAILEHANLTFSLRKDLYSSFKSLIDDDDNKVSNISKYCLFSQFVTYNTSNDVNIAENNIFKYVITISLRGILELLESNICEVYDLGNILVKSWPVDDYIKCILFSNYMNDFTSNIDEDFCKFIEPKIVNLFTNPFRNKHKFVSVKFICDRGVSHELVRHRCSFAQESTRYCNYTKDKFGNEITVIKPFFFNEDSNPHIIEVEDGNEFFFNRYDVWKRCMQQIENAYFGLIEDGATAQEARSILPNSLKTEIVVTMNLQQWGHFFKLRCADAAHPQMRQLTIPLLEQFKIEFGDNI